MRPDAPDRPPRSAAPPSCAPAPAGATPGSAPVPFPASGQVLDAVVEGDTAYVAGYLRAVGSAPGPLTILNATGTVRRTFPEITSNGAPEELHNEGVVPDLDVLALEPDGAGGFYVGGEFDKVLGQRRVNLVHLRADGTIDPVFSAQALGPVRALEVRGDALFVGGGFTVIGGELRTSLAKLDARTGEVLDWGPAAGIAPISDLSISGDRLYAAGSGRGATAFDLATGRVLDWDPELGTSTDLSAIAARDDRVFLGGDFDEVHGEERSGAVLVGTDDAATLSPWVFRAGEVTQIELGPQVVVMLGGRLQNDEVTLRAYDLSTGERRPWFGDLARTAQGITTEGETLYVATESEIAAFDLRTGARLPYRGASDGRVLAAGGGALAAAGGGLRDTVARVGAAAVDLRTNAVLPFDAQVAGAVMHRVPYYEGPWVSAVEKAGDTVYLGGVFATVGGRPQQSLAAVDATTGAWRPGFPTVTGGPVNALAVSGTTLFVGGDFAELGGRPVTRLGAIDLATGQVHAWAPSLPFGCPVTAMEVVGPTLFVGACGLRAYDVATRAALPLTGQPSMAVHALEPDGLGGIWVGGKASGDGDVHLRHIDANGFNVPYAVTDGPVDEIEAAGAELFLAGAFSEIAGERRWNLGSIDLSTGRATRFRPEPGTSPWVSNDVTMLEALPGGGLLVGGGFQYLAAAAVPGLARFAPGGETSPPTPRGAAPVVVGGAATGSLQWVYGGDFAGNPSVEVRWERCAGATCTDAGQMGWSYNLRDADAGHRMRAVLVAHNDAGSFALETAPGPLALGPKPFAIYPAYPYMYGDPRVGATLTMADGLWDPAPTSQRYTWTRCDYDVGCRPIPGATGRTYTTTSADAGQRLRATVYAINAAGERAFSAQEEIGPILANPSSGRNGARSRRPRSGRRSVTSCTATATSGATARAAGSAGSAAMRPERTARGSRPSCRRTSSSRPTKVTRSVRR